MKRHVLAYCRGCETIMSQDEVLDHPDEHDMIDLSITADPAKLARGGAFLLIPDEWKQGRDRVTAA